MYQVTVHTSTGLLWPELVVAYLSNFITWGTNMETLDGFAAYQYGWRKVCNSEIIVNLTVKERERENLIMTGKGDSDFRWFIWTNFFVFVFSKLSKNMALFNYNLTKWYLLCLKILKVFHNNWTNFNQTFWVKVTQVCSNEGPDLFPRGDNNEIEKNPVSKDI